MITDIRAYSLCRDGFATVHSPTPMILAKLPVRLALDQDKNNVKLTS